jgi:hypothetical protein
MDNVLCPHCGQAVLCNPQLAAQVVACPGCQGHFTMPATALPPTVTTSLPPPVIRTSHSEPPPRIVTAPPKQPHATVKRPRQDQRTLLVAGIAAAVLLLVGIGLVVVINWPPGESGAVAADGDRRSRGDLTGGHENELLDPSRPLPPLDQLIGRSFPADHPDAEARIAEASERKISVMQGGGKVQLGDVSVADIPTGDYPGFQFGMITEKDGRILLTTNDGKEPLQIPRSFASHRSIVQRFLEQHHGAAIRIEQLTDQPYYLARLKSDQEQRPGATPETHHGRSREKIQANLDQLAELGIRYSISKLERIGTVVRAVHRVGPAQTDEEFLVVNNKVVLHFGSIVSVITGGD